MPVPLIFGALLGGFAGWWARNRGLSKDKAEEFLHNILQSASAGSERFGHTVMELFQSAAKGGTEAYEGLDKIIREFSDTVIKGYEHILDDLRSDFASKHGVAADQLYLLRVDESANSETARNILREHGISFREIDPTSPFSTVLYRRVAPPSLITPDNRVLIGVNAIREYCEKPKGDEKDSSDPTAKPDAQPQSFEWGGCGSSCPD